MKIDLRGKNVFESFVEGFFSPIASELSDASISEVMINGPSEIFVERRGRLERVSARFESERALLGALRAAAQYLGRPLDDDNPILEGRLPDGSRLQAILAPLAEGGPCVAIRRHKTESLSLEQLVEWGALNQEACDLLRDLVHQKKNILVSGGTGSGKTSLLRCVASLIPPDDRIVCIEDARELSLQSPHVVSLESRPAQDERAPIQIRELFIATLRLRPDRIVIGELRSGEALDLVQAMTSGHGGCLSTIHASSPEDALRRLETLCLLSGVDLPLVALRAQVASAVNAIVQVERLGSGHRWVRSIARVSGLNPDGSYRVDPILERPGGRGALVRVEEPFGG